MGKAEALRPGLIARSMLDSVLSVLLAPPCAACQAPLDAPTAGPICGACWSAVRVSAAPFTIRGITHARAAGVYDGSLREIVHALKYQGRRSLAVPLGALILEHCADVLHGAAAVVPVPLHASRERERGFNQADLIARALPLPCVKLLRRVRATPSQTDLPADERRANVRGAFDTGSRLAAFGSQLSAFGHRRSAFGRRREMNVPGTVVLVDDVATTGATLGECARVLRRLGVREVRAAVVARAV